jgi:hypothetical protein
MAARTVPFQALVTAERVVDTLLISTDYNNPSDERLRYIKLGNLNSVTILLPCYERAQPNAVLGPESVQVAERDNSPTYDISLEPRSSRPQSTDFSDPCCSPAFRTPRPDTCAALDRLCPTIGDS